MDSTPEILFDDWFQTEHGIEAPPITSEDFDLCVEDCYDEDSFGDIEKDSTGIDESFFLG